MTSPAPVSDAARQMILAFADDEHLMGQQHTEWIGVAPFLEEDLAFASIGQDELGHAALLLEVLVGTADADIDALAFFRDADEWRSCALVEATLPDWGDTLVRHWLYDSAEELRWQRFASSSIPALADLAVRAESEERFHRPSRRRVARCPAHPGRGPSTDPTIPDDAVATRTDHVRGRFSRG